MSAYDGLILVAIAYFVILGWKTDIRTGALAFVGYLLGVLMGWAS